MNKRDCNLDEHTYSLWKLNNQNTVERTCTKCKKTTTYPITSEILTQIKKQYEAILLLENFLNVSPDDPNLIGYLNVILEDVVDYINEAQKQSFITKLNQLINTNFLNEENKIIIFNFINSLNANDTDLFFDTMEKFKELNREIKFIQPKHKLG